MFSFAFLLALITTCLCGTPEEWKSRAIYQLLTDRFARSDDNYQPCKNLESYCGGTFKGIIRNLDYIADMGFTAIWISPVFQNYGDRSYHGYWTSDFYEINPNFGTSEELYELVEACHARGIWVMVDMVLNHVAPVGNSFYKIKPFNLDEHYHEKCEIKDWENEFELHNCRLCNLPDLNHENEWVKMTLIEWAQLFVVQYNIDGLRLDAVGHIPHHFWREFVPAVNVFQMGEVMQYKYIAGYQTIIDGMLNYPLYWALREVFKELKDMRRLVRYFDEERKMWTDETLLGNFIGNHDEQRFLKDFNNIQMLKAATAFVIGYVGIPIIYYGDEQAFPGDSRYGKKDVAARESLWAEMDTSHEVYKFIQNILMYRAESEFYKADQIQREYDNSFYSFTRGKVFFAFTNSMKREHRDIRNHPYKEKNTLCNLFDDEDIVEVKHGSFPVVLNNGEVKIYYLCNVEEKKVLDVKEKDIKIKQANSIGLTKEELESIFAALPGDVEELKSYMASFKPK